MPAWLCTQIVARTVATSDALLQVAVNSISAPLIGRHAVSCTKGYRFGSDKEKLSEVIRSTFVNFSQTPQAGAVKLPGLFAVPRHSGFRSLLASHRARRTPPASKSLA